MVASNSRVLLPEGSTFRQASLSDYFKGLGLITNASDGGPEYENSLYFPMREFRLDALLLDDGSSMLKRLCLIADLIMIEDVDLTADILGKHLESNDLHDLAASDLTSRSRMKYANLLCVSRKDLQSALPEKRIW